MTEPAELAYAVLGRVADFLRGLPPEQLTALARGDAHLELISMESATDPHRPSGPPQESGSPPSAVAPASGVRSPSGALPAPASLPRPAGEIGAELVALGERAAAAAYLDGLNLSLVQLRALARQLGIAVASKATKAQARDTVVHWTVGRRADAAILSSPE